MAIRYPITISYSLSIYPALSSLIKYYNSSVGYKGKVIHPYIHRVGGRGRL